MSYVGKAEKARRASSSYRKMQTEKEKAQEAEVDEWFTKFDLDASGTLDRNELTALLKYIHPETEPTDAALDYLIKKATEINTFSIQISGSTTGFLTREAARQTVKRYRAYIREQVYIDSVLEKFDEDKSGTIDRKELINLLSALIPGSYPDEFDVKFLLDNCDQDGDGVFSREELVPMLGLWYQRGGFRDDKPASVPASPPGPEPPETTAPMPKEEEGEEKAGAKLQIAVPPAAVQKSESKTRMRRPTAYPDPDAANKKSSACVLL